MGIAALNPSYELDCVSVAVDERRRNRWPPQAGGAGPVAMTMAATRPISILFIRATPFADCDQNAILSLAMVWECDNGFGDFR